MKYSEAKYGLEYSMWMRSECFRADGCNRAAI
jgi:hypothetical protein